MKSKVLRKQAELKRLKQRLEFLQKEMDKVAKQIKGLEIGNEYDISAELKKAKSA